MNVTFTVVPVVRVTTVWTELSSSVTLLHVAFTQYLPVSHTSTTVARMLLTHLEPSGECWHVGFSSKRMTLLLLQSRCDFAPPQSAVVAQEPANVVVVVVVDAVIVVVFFAVVVVMETVVVGTVDDDVGVGGREVEVVAISVVVVDVCVVNGFDVRSDGTHMQPARSMTAANTR